MQGQAGPAGSALTVFTHEPDGRRLSCRVTYALDEARRPGTPALDDATRNDPGTLF